MANEAELASAEPAAAAAAKAAVEAAKATAEEAPQVQGLMLSCLLRGVPHAALFWRASV